MARRVLPLVFASGLLAGAAFAQIGYPGGYPPGGYPPGGYPPGSYPPGGGYPPGSYPPGGQYPGGGAGVPIGGGRRTKKQTKEAAALPVVDATGIVRIMNDRMLVMEADDKRIIAVQIENATKLEKSATDAKLTDFRPGDHIAMEAGEDEKGYLHGTRISWEKAGTPAEYAAATRPVDAMPPAARSIARGEAPREAGDERPHLRRADGNADEAKKQAEPKAEQEQESFADSRPSTVVKPPDLPSDPDDSGPPRISRGIPTRRAAAPEPSAAAQAPKAAAAEPNRRPSLETQTVASTAPTTDLVITKARHSVEEFMETLPNYVVQQHTTRYFSETPKPDWRAQDVVSAEVVCIQGSEEYRNIRVNNKPVNKSMMDIGGSTSVGEFAATLQDLFAPSTNAHFRPRGMDTIAHRNAYRYDFTVDQPNSHWTIMSTSQTYRPQYRGTVWIDKETNRVLRIEMQARNMPQGFPFDTTEQTLDYDFVRLGTQQEYLLPVQSENLSCQRGTSYCNRNALEFRNYRKFGSEAEITFEPPKQ